MSKKLLALLLILQSSTSLAQTATDPATITVTMGDDGSVNVPLEFEFPLYGKLFTDSWMYDNGIISFLQPGSPGSISPWQWSAQPLTQSGGNYFIASLWADIAPTQQTTYKYQGDSTFMKYTWTNIAEYYSAWDPSPRYSTFSTTIKPDGTITTSFASINLRTSNIASGIVGDTSLGQVEQYYYATNGTVLTTGGISDWTFVGSYTPPPPPPPEPPIVTQPDPIPVATNTVQEEIIQEEPVVQQVAQTIVIEPEPLKQQVVVEAVSAQQSVVSDPVSNIVAAVSSLDKKALNVDAQSIARNNQKNLAALTDSVVSSSIQGSIEAGALSADASISGGASSLLGGSSSSSTTFSSVSMDSASSTQTQSSIQSTKLVSAITGTDAISMGVPQQDSSSSAQYQNSSQQSTQSTSGSTVDMLMPAQRSVQLSEDETQSQLSIPESIDSTLALFKPLKGSSSESMFDVGPEISTSVEDQATGLNMLADLPGNPMVDDINPLSIRNLGYVSPRVQFEDEEQKSNSFDKTVETQDPALAELAESGAKIQELQVVPVGYFNYLNLAYKDVAFYKDRVIYRKQKPVDNLRILRLLNARSDLTYNKMLETQYSLEDM